MRKIKKWVRNWLADYDQPISEPEYSTSSAKYGNAIKASTSEITLNSSGMHFQIYYARGGIVIETRSYDSRTDRSDNKLYVIQEEKDLGTEISKILTMEALKS